MQNVAISLSRITICCALLLPVSLLRAETYHDWCQSHFSADQIASGLASPLRDADQDLCTNVIEYFGGTDPLDFQSRLEITSAPTPGAISFPMAADREDVVYEVVVSLDLHTWSEDAVPVCAGPEVWWHLNGAPYVKLGVKRRIGFMLDSDQDGLDDFFEEALVASDPNDALTHLGEVLPWDDFDGDGTANLDEEDNRPQPMPGGSFAAPPVVDPAALAYALDPLAHPPTTSLVVHTPLR